MAALTLPRRRTLLVREANPFPVDIAGLELDLDADRILPVLADGDPVATWPDRSGKGRNATQANAAAKPTWKINILNGRAVVRFDGGDYLDTAAIAAFDLDTWTWFTVYNTSAPNSAQVAVRSGYGSGAGVAQSGRLLGTYQGSNVVAVHARVADGTIKQATAALAADTFLIATGQWDSIDQVLGWKNGTSMGAAVTGATAVPSGHLWVRVGADSVGDPATASFLTGDIARVLFYSRVLSDAERVRVERYLGLRYGIAVA